MPTFYDRFVECASRWPEHVCLEIQRRDRVESYTYAETRRMAESVGRWLQTQGLEPGSRCAILADNHPRWVVAFLGIISAGHTAVPLDTALRAEQTAKLLADSNTVLLFCDWKHLHLAQQATESLRATIVLTDERRGGDKHFQGSLPGLDGMFATGPADFRPVESPPEAIASLLYTSGTTADPKGVILTHANLLGEVASVFSWAEIGPEDSVLGVLPLFHVLSQMANLLLPLVKGARVVYLETLNTTELLRALQERKITTFAVVPQFYYMIHERIFKEVGKRGRLARSVFRAMMAITAAARRLGLSPGKLFFGRIHRTLGSSMRYLVTGGSRFDPHVASDFYALGIDVLQAYGLTETTGGAFVQRPEDYVVGSVGPPLPGVEGRILDPQASEIGPAIGEIAIRGAIVMKGYWNRPDATAAALQDGWLHTGDLGYFDKHGNLFITGRKKEIIVLSNGKNIYPEEVESHYQRSPYIREICVMGIEGRPGEAGSDRLHAVVVPDFEILKQRKIVNAKEVLRFDIEGLSAQLPSTKRIGSYEIWQEDLPRTTTRKLKRFVIEERVRSQGMSRRTMDADVTSEKPLSAEDEEWLQPAEVQHALALIAESTSKALDAIRSGDNLELDLGLDSMQRVELLVGLEQVLGGDLEESRLAEIYTVRELVDAVRQSAAGGKTAARPQVLGWKAVLEEDSNDPELRDLVRPRPLAEAFWFAVSRLVRLISDDVFHLRVEGLDKLPEAPCIICSNHQSYIDPIVMGSVFPWLMFRQLFSVGTSDIFGSGFMRRLARWLRVVVVDPDRNLIPAMRAGAFGLRHGRSLILYPEGERSIDGTPKTFKKGAAILSVHLQVPIVPVAIDGFEKAWPRGKRMLQKFYPLRIRFGDPIPPPEMGAGEAAYDKLTKELKSRVVSMWEDLRRDSRNV